MIFQSSVSIEKDSILILPSWNSVNQINTVLDLLIFNTGFKKIGILESMFTVPMAGSDAFGGDGLCSAIEVYQKDNIILVQARSTIYKGRGIEFVNDLVAWIKSLDVAKVLIVSSADSGRKPDGAENWLAAVNCGFSGLDGMGISLLDVSVPSHLSVPVGNTLWPVGGGLTRWIYAKLKDCKINLGVLIAFCSEGDIRGIATHLAEKVNQLTRQESIKLFKFPPSWTAQDKFVNYQTELYG
jgi:proteasome assembly chaperone 2